MPSKVYTRADWRRYVIGDKPRMSATVPDRIGVWAVRAECLRPVSGAFGVDRALNINEHLVLTLDLNQPKATLKRAFDVLVETLQRQHRSKRAELPSDLDLEIWRRRRKLRHTFPRISLDLRSHFRGKADPEDVRRQVVAKFGRVEKFMKAHPDIGRQDWWKVRLERPSGFLRP